MLENLFLLNLIKIEAYTKPSSVKFLASNSKSSDDVNDVMLVNN